MITVHMKWTRELSEEFERVNLPDVWSWATHFYLPRKSCAGAVWLLRTPAARSVGRVRRAAAPGHHGHPPCVEVELFAPSLCDARCVERRDEGVIHP